MTKLADHPMLLIHYPTGAGGWFLASLLHYAYDQRHPLSFDNVGSGHANQHIRLINNWYDEIIPTAIGEALIHDYHYDMYTEQQRIDFLRDNLSATELFDKNTVHVLSLHCANINVFMKALPYSKCIQINVNDDDLLKCTGLFLKKKLSFEQFAIFAQQFSVPEYQYSSLFQKLQHIQTLDDLVDFHWAVPYITSLQKNVENDTEFDTRMFEIMFTDLMTANADQLIQSLLTFMEHTVSQQTYDNLINYLETYRNQQPFFAVFKNYE